MSWAIAGLLLTAAHAVGESSSPVSSVAGGHAVQCLPKRVAPGLFVGPTPDDAAFAWLARQGVKTVVSVDGARPDVELAAKHGLRYVHAPFGYDGVSREAQLALTRVAREAAGVVYVHCHHGKHRGPAAAAIVARARGQLASDDEVRALLTRAGTDPRFAGLWRDATCYRPPPPETPLPRLVAAARVDPLTAAMAAAGRAWRRLDEAVGEGDREGELRAALLLREAFRESTRPAGQRSNSHAPAELIAWLGEAEATATRLENARDPAEFARLRATLANQCQRCHERHRD